MILDTLAHAERYRALHPLFERAFDFLRDTDLMALAPGKHDVQGEQIFAIVEACEGRTRAEAKLECHRRYIDIQLVLAGVDEMGCGRRRRDGLEAGRGVWRSGDRLRSRARHPLL